MVNLNQNQNPPAYPHPLISSKPTKAFSMNRRRPPLPSPLLPRRRGRRSGNRWQKALPHSVGEDVSPSPREERAGREPERGAALKNCPPLLRLRSEERERIRPSIGQSCARNFCRNCQTLGVLRQKRRISHGLKNSFPPRQSHRFLFSTPWTL